MSPLASSYPAMPKPPGRAALLRADERANAHGCAILSFLVELSRNQNPAGRVVPPSKQRRERPRILPNDFPPAVRIDASPMWQPEWRVRHLADWL